MGARSLTGCEPNQKIFSDTPNDVNMSPGHGSGLMQKIAIGGEFCLASAVSINLEGAIYRRGSRE